MDLDRFVMSCVRGSVFSPLMLLPVPEVSKVPWRQILMTDHLRSPDIDTGDVPWAVLAAHPSTASW